MLVSVSKTANLLNNPHILEQIVQNVEVIFKCHARHGSLMISDKNDSK